MTNDSGANAAFSNSSISISAQGPASFLALAGEMPARRAERLQSCLVDWFLLEVRVHWSIRRTSTSLFDSQLVAQLAASLQIGAGRFASPRMAAGGDTKCALIDLSAEEPKRVAQVLKKAWMEGGVKVCISSGSCTDALLLTPSAEYVR